MKYLSVGKIKVSDGKYYISLFDGKRTGVFEDTDNLLVFIKDNMSEFFRKGTATGASIDVINDGGGLHHLMFDNAWEDNESIVFESTDYEFLTSHKPYHRTKKYRQVVNSREYSYQSIARVSSHWRPWWKKVISFTTLFSFFITMIYELVSFGIISNHKVVIPDSVEDFLLSYTVISIIAVSVITFTVTWSSYILYRKVAIPRERYETVDWRTFRNIRQKTSIILFVLYTVLTIFTSVLLSIVEKQILPIKTLEGHEMLQIMAYLILAISVFSLALFSSSIIRSIYKTRKNLDYYFPDLNEKNDYYLWLKKRAENRAKGIADSRHYFFDPAPSQQANLTILKSTESLMEELSPYEMKRYMKKVKRAINGSIDSM